MPERIPLAYNSDANQIQEPATTDELRIGFTTATVFSNPNRLDENVSLANSHFNYMHLGPITVGAGYSITVGAGVSYVVI